MAYLNHYRGNSAHRPQEVLLAQFSLYVHKGGLNYLSFQFISFSAVIAYFSSKSLPQ